MREQILKLLMRAVELYKEITVVYRNRLPQNILDGSKHTIESDIPRHLNTFISVVNMVERVDKYPQIKNIEAAIEVFSISDLDKSIQKSMEDENIVGYGGDQAGMTAKDILEYSKDAVRSGIELLALQIAAAKL
jgi:hypothetical protein